MVGVRAGNLLPTAALQYKPDNGKGIHLIQSETRAAESHTRRMRLRLAKRNGKAPTKVTKLWKQLTQFGFPPMYR